MRLFTTLCVILFSSCCYAGTPEPIEHLKSVTNDFVMRNVSLEGDDTINVEIFPPDLARKITVCPKEIVAALPPDSNRDHITSVELSCNSQEPWRVLVPVSVHINTKVVVAKKVLPLNQEITEDDLDVSYYDRDHLYSGYFKNKDEVIGCTTTQMISSGTVLTKKNIHAALMVHRNQEVELSVINNSISVTMKGIAKTDGSLHDAVKIFNPSSKQIIDAIVVGQNRAEITY